MRGVEGEERVGTDSPDFLRRDSFRVSEKLPDFLRDAGDGGTPTSTSCPLAALASSSNEENDSLSLDLLLPRVVRESTALEAQPATLNRRGRSSCSFSLASFGESLSSSKLCWDFALELARFLDSLEDGREPDLDEGRDGGRLPPPVDCDLRCFRLKRLGLASSTSLSEESPSD
jgi:hypothetical protein